MEKETSIAAEEIRLIKIEVVRNKIDVSLFKKVSKPLLTLVHQTLNQTEENRIKIEMIFSFKDNNDIEIFLIQINFLYNIKNLVDYYEINEENNPVFSTSLIATLRSISYSTSRGIVFEKLDALGIKNIIIPAISPNTLLGDDL